MDDVEFGPRARALMEALQKRWPLEAVASAPELAMGALNISAEEANHFNYMVGVLCQAMLDRGYEPSAVIEFAFAFGCEVGRTSKEI